MKVQYNRNIPLLTALLYDMYKCAVCAFRPRSETCNSNKRAGMGDRRVAYRFLVGKTEGNRTLGRPSLICENNIKLILQQMIWEGVNWIYVTQNIEE